MPSSQTELEGPDKHDEYWFENGDLVLLVDKVYFKVHRDLLARTSGLIKDMLAMPIGENQSRVEGTTMDNAIAIPEVPYQHFEVILHAAYGRFKLPHLPPLDELVMSDYFDSHVSSTDLVELLHTAHRLQVPSVIVPIAELVLPYIGPAERFALCHNLGLDEIRSASEQEHRLEDLRVQSAVNARNERRGVRCQLGCRVEPPESATNTWLMDAFAAIVLARDVKMPSPELSDKTALHVMLGRERVTELRISTIEKWINTRNGYNRGDILCASTFWQFQRDCVREFYTSGSQTYTANIVQAVRTALPSEQEELAVIKSYWEAAGL